MTRENPTPFQAPHPLPWMSTWPSACGMILTTADEVYRCGNYWRHVDTTPSTTQFRPELLKDVGPLLVLAYPHPEHETVR